MIVLDRDSIEQEYASPALIRNVVLGPVGRADEDGAWEVIHNTDDTVVIYGDVTLAELKQALAMLEKP